MKYCIVFPGKPGNDPGAQCRYLYTACHQSIDMKKQAEQKTKGHKATDNPVTTAPVNAANPIDKQKINSLKDKNAAKTKRGKH